MSYLRYLYLLVHSGAKHIQQTSTITNY
jgi:hypothetical protein